MSDKLKIYACSGIGEAEQKPTYTYWTDNTDTVSKTQAVNSLLVLINSTYTEFKYLQLTPGERLQHLNDIDLYTVCLEAAKRYTEDSDALYKAGTVIGGMISAGDFNYQELDESKRDEHLDELIEKANEAFESELLTEKQNDVFNQWWKETIVSRNKVGLSKTAQKKSMQALNQAVKGLGDVDESWKENKDIAQYLTKAGTYFLYLFFTDAQLSKLPKKFRVKRQYQTRIYNYCKAYFVDVYGSEADMQEIIRNGIIQEFKETPEALCAAIASGKPKGVGVITTAIVIGAKEFITILAVVAGALIAIVTAICDAVYKSNVQKYAAMERSVIEGGTPDAEDYDGLEFGDDGLFGKESNKSWWLLAGAGVLALLLARK